MPYITEVSSSGWRTYDIFSKLLQERIICLNGAIDDTVSASIVAQLLWLESDNPDKAITLYINSPGGSVTSGLAIYDTMTYIKSPVSTVCLGAASSMGALLLTGGEAGKRYALPHSSVMIHQPLGGTQGQASDILIYANQIQRVRTKLNEIMRRHLNTAFGRERYTLEEVNDMMERDKYLSPEEAKDIGVIDEILTRRTEKDEKEKDNAQKTKPVLSQCQCRHASTARPSRAETRAALAAQVDRALQADEHGATLKLHPESKTIETVVGDLPISPVMDPAWMEARRRFRMPKAKTPSHTCVGRFRKKLYLNPYAQALATPWRLCTATDTGLPRYFLQDFKVVTNPETGQPWFVPGDLTDPPQGSSLATPSAENPSSKQAVPERSPAYHASAEASRSPSPSAPKGYALARHEVLNLLGAPRHTSTLGGKHVGMLARRAHLSKSGLLSRLIWPSRMHLLVLDLLRSRVVDQLLHLARLDAPPANSAYGPASAPRGYIRPCRSWSEINQTMPHRGCILWYADASTAAPGQWATLDIDGAKYEGKMPVHDLRRLLGDGHIARLRGEPVFGENTLLVLGKRRTIEAQLLLWKLQGYLAEYPASIEAETV
ncbi:hypothetical protein ACHAQH_007772 [Verticillium albo-atrum]